MFTNPQINSPAFQSLRQICHKSNLKLLLAKDYKQYQKMGGNFAVYCKFSNMEVCVGESLQEIADFLKIGGVYD